jgi:hypothetical protein
MSAREDIATAASTVVDVEVDPWPQQHTKAGKGYVAWAGAARDDSGFGFMDQWVVYIVLPTPIVEAEEWIESHRDGLVAALKHELVITTLTPVRLSMDDLGDVNALSLTGARAH